MNSFHMNVGSYYNRQNMHMAWGYSEYYAGVDYLETILAEDDSELIQNPEYWGYMTKTRPFLSFFVSYSAHVPYTNDDELVQWAMKKHPEYNTLSNNSELNCALAKARLTDDMFKVLLEKLQEDDLIDDTIIIAYADHYCYGLSDKELIQKMTEENGTSILERTPAFIWYKDCKAEQVDKVCQTIDWLPTIANMFGEDITDKVLGNDIFDNDYSGIAIFPNGSWITNTAYVKNGVTQWNSGMKENEIDNMNKYVRTFYDVNDAILSTDYYRKIKERK